MHWLMLVPLMLAAPAGAQGAEEAAVLETVEGMFDALAAKDAAGFLALTHPEGKATAAVTTGAGEKRIVSSDWATFAGRLASIPGRPVERNIDPQVRIDGDIAMVWSPYLFTLDGELAHCGTNHFDLVRKEGAWKVLNVTWTQRKTGCPTP